MIVGYSYTNDIKEAKGRKQRKVFARTDLTRSVHSAQLYAKERVESGDPAFTKFMVKKERISGHH